MAELLRTRSFKADVDDFPAPKIGRSRRAAGTVCRSRRKMHASAVGQPRQSHASCSRPGARQAPNARRPSGAPGQPVVAGGAVSTAPWSPTRREPAPPGTSGTPSSVKEMLTEATQAARAAAPGLGSPAASSTGRACRRSRSMDAWKKTFEAHTRGREVDDGPTTEELITPGTGRWTSGRLRPVRFLLKLLVRKELKVRYRGSVLGLLWSYVKPARAVPRLLRGPGRLPGPRTSAGTRTASELCGLSVLRHRADQLLHRSARATPRGRSWTTGT